MVKLSRESSRLKELQSNSKKNYYRKSSNKSNDNKDNGLGLKKKLSTMNDLSAGSGNLDNENKGFFPKQPEILKDTELAKQFKEMSLNVRLIYDKNSSLKNLDDHKKLVEKAIREKYGNVEPQMQEYIDAYFDYSKQCAGKVKKYGIIIFILFFFSPFLLFLLPIIIPIAIFYAVKKSFSKK